MSRTLEKERFVEELAGRLGIPYYQVNYFFINQKDERSFEEAIKCYHEADKNSCGKFISLMRATEVCETYQEIRQLIDLGSSRAYMSELKGFNSRFRSDFGKVPETVIIQSSILDKMVQIFLETNGEFHELDDEFRSNDYLVPKRREMIKILLASDGYLKSQDGILGTIWNSIGTQDSDMNEEIFHAWLNSCKKAKDFDQLEEYITSLKNKKKFNKPSGFVNILKEKKNKIFKNRFYSSNNHFGEAKATLDFIKPGDDNYVTALCYCLMFFKNVDDLRDNYFEIPPAYWLESLTFLGNIWKNK